MVVVVVVVGRERAMAMAKAVREGCLGKLGGLRAGEAEAAAQLMLVLAMRGVRGGRSLVVLVV